MGHEFSIDVDDVHLFHGYEWVDLGDPCDHGCDHRATSVIAWGPTVATYELLECDLCGCRAWEDGRYAQLRKVDPDAARWWQEQTSWRQTGITPTFGPAPTGEDGGK